MAANGAQEVATLTRPLDAQAARSAGFTATYRIEMPGERQSLRLVYLAPDRARVDFQMSDLAYTMWVTGGEVTFRMESPEGTNVARASAEDLDNLWSGCDTSLESAFPSSSSGDDSPTDLGPGPSLELTFPSTEVSSADHPITASVGWAAHRATFLSWLGAAASWTRANLEGDAFLNLYRPDARARVSRSTGLIDELTQGANLVLRLVEYHDHVDPIEFETPGPNAIFNDMSPQVRDAIDLNTWRLIRERVYARLLPAARSSSDDPIEFRRRAASVFLALHRPILKHLYASAALEWSLGIDQFCQWYGSGLRASAPNSDDRNGVESAAAHWRAELESTMAKTRDSTVAGLESVAIDEEGSETLAELLDLERDAARAAFKDEVSDPLLRRFDEQVKQIRGAR